MFTLLQYSVIVVRAPAVVVRKLTAVTCLLVDHIDFCFGLSCCRIRSDWSNINVIKYPWGWGKSMILLLIFGL